MALIQCNLLITYNNLFNQAHDLPKRGLAVASVWNENKGLSYLNQLADY